MPADLQDTVQRSHLGYPAPGWGWCVRLLLGLSLPRLGHGTCIHTAVDPSPFFDLKIYLSTLDSALRISGLPDCLIAYGPTYCGVGVIARIYDSAALLHTNPRVLNLCIIRTGGLFMSSLLGSVYRRTVHLILYI